MKKKLFKISLYLIFIFGSTTVFAQDNLLYNMSHVPQQMQTNPAKQPACKVFIGFPALSSIYMDINNTGFVFKDNFKKIYIKNENKWMPDISKLRNVLDTKNTLDFQFQMDLLNFGFRFNQTYFISLSLGTKIDQRFTYPRGWTDIPNHGNWDINETPINLGFSENFMAYNELGVGLSKEFFSGLTVGVKVKYLSGISNISTKSMKLDWTTQNGVEEDEFYDWTFNTDYEIRTSGPADWEFVKNDTTGIIDSIDVKNEDNISYSKYGLSSPNKGFGFDFGVDYKINNMFSVSASVIDLGYIKWNDNPRILKQRGTYTFDGIDIGKYMDNSEDVENAETDEWKEITDDLIDTITTFLDPSIEKTSYKTPLNTKIFIGGNYNVTKWFNLGLLYRGYFYEHKLQSAYSLSGNLNFMHGWSLSGSWSRWNKMNNVVGLGLAYKIGPFQLYLISDNIAPAFWATNNTAVGERWIRNTKKTTFHFGINLLFGCKQKLDYGLIE